MSDDTKEKRLEPLVKVSHKVDKWRMYRFVNKLYTSFPHLRQPEYHARVYRYARMSILHQRFLDAFAAPDVPLLNERGELHASFDTIRQYADSLQKMEKFLFDKVPRSEKTVKSLDELRREADEADAEMGDEERDDEAR
jgi:hypothetical protein